MDIKQIRYFLSIVQMGSYTLAADELFVSQSYLSKQILALEKKIGYPLIDRSKRKICLTPVGEIFVKYANRFIETQKDFQEELEEYTRTAVAFSIVAIPVIAQYGISTYIADFRRDYPNINFYFEEREASTIIPLLENRQFDLAFIRNHYIDETKFSMVDIFTDRLLVILPVGHPLSSHSSISLPELAHENFVMFEKGTVVHELTTDICRKAGFEPIITYTSIHVESIVSLVANKIGVALVMQRVIEHMNPPDIIAVPLDQNIESKIVIAYLKKKRLPKSAQLFIDMVKRNFRT